MYIYVHIIICMHVYLRLVTYYVYIYKKVITSYVMHIYVCSIIY